MYHVRMLVVLYRQPRQIHPEGRCEPVAINCNLVRTDQRGLMSRLSLSNNLLRVEGITGYESPSISMLLGEEAGIPRMKCLD